jgi:hypothetical protein
MNIKTAFALSILAVISVSSSCVTAASLTQNQKEGGAIATLGAIVLISGSKSYIANVAGAACLIGGSLHVAGRSNNAKDYIIGKLTALQNWAASNN